MPLGSRPSSQIDTLRPMICSPRSMKDRPSCTASAEKPDHDRYSRREATAYSSRMTEYSPGSRSPPSWLRVALSAASSPTARAAIERRSAAVPWAYPDPPCPSRITVSSLPWVTLCEFDMPRLLATARLDASIETEQLHSTAPA